MNFEAIIQADMRKSSTTCFVLAHPEIQMLVKAQAVIERLKIPILPIGKELSTLLLDVQRVEHSRAILRWFEARFASGDGNRPNASQPLACSQIDLLFEPCFQLDPVALFRRAARNHKLLVLWPGDVTNHSLSYAVPEHRHYRTWRIDDPTLQIIRLQD